MGQVILKRILTFKSLLKFGKYKDYRIEELIALNRDKEIISPYFNLSSIDFIEEVLVAVGIEERFRIKKPGKDLEMYKTFLTEGKHRIRKPKDRSLTGADKLRGRGTENAFIKTDTRKNQGHKLN